MFPVESKLVLNASSSLIRKINALHDTDRDKADLLAKQVYSLSVLTHRKFTAEELNAFLADSYTMLEKL